MGKELDIKRCPFCGNDAGLYVIGYVGTYIVKCADCGSRSGEFVKKEKAVKAWNKRKND